METRWPAMSSRLCARCSCKFGSLSKPCCPAAVFAASTAFAAVLLQCIQIGITFNILLASPPPVSFQAQHDPFICCIACAAKGF